MGTIETPVNIYNDTEIGQIYSVTGYVVFSSPTNPIDLSNYNYLFFRESEGRAICFNRGDTGHGLSIIQYYVSPTYMSRADYGTVVKLNGVNYQTVPNIYVPTTSGTTGQILQSNGASNAPTWFTPDYASQSYVDTQIANLVDSAPETLNTLNELAQAIQEHKDILDAIGQLPTVTRLI